MLTESVFEGSHSKMIDIFDCCAIMDDHVRPVPK